MKDILVEFMDSLEAVGKLYPELYDTAVREQMAGAMFNGFVKPKSDWSVDTCSFGMFSDQANDAVRVAVAAFLVSANRIGSGLSFDERIKAVWNYEARSKSEKRADDFLGAI